METAREKVGLVRMAGRIMSWIIGVFLILIGLVGGLTDPQGGSLVMGLGLAGAGAVILPPVVALARAKARVLSPYWVPPFASLCVLVLAMIVGGPALVASQAASPEGRARAAEEAVEDA